jgi:oligoribonuclease NrnB/cAMP/cGMP phosphodiesterase (DHH superfamily)
MMAATIAYESLRNLNESILLVPSPPAKFPTFLPRDYREPTTGDTIYLLDTCFEPPTLQKLSLQIDKNLIVLDHHEYSRNWVKTYCDGIHDIHRSGCRLAWDYFYPNELPPRSVLYVEDRDLWKWKYLPESKHFNDYFYTMIPIKLDEYRPFVFSQSHDELISESVSKGILIGHFIQMQINEISKSASFKVWCNQKIAIVNSGLYVSELSAHLLSLKDKSDATYLCDCAFVWSKNEKIGEYKVSLRSRHNVDGSVSADVNDMAAKFGGGGHKTASGFTCSDLESVLIHI